MTPSLSSQIHAAPAPLEMLRLAVQACTKLRVRLRFGDHSGVSRGHLSREWHVDRPTDSAVAFVNPVGAVLLALQPTETPDAPERAAARALGVPFAYVEGLVDGWNRQSHNRAMVEPHETRKAYLQGYEVGVLARHEMSRECAACGSRVMDYEPCPLCEERGRA